MPELSKGRGNRGRHGLRFIAQATFDHVHPASRGGANDESNLVSACWICNFGKAHYLLEEELGLEELYASNPPVRRDSWDGLVSQLSTKQPR